MARDVEPLGLGRCGRARDRHRLLPVGAASATGLESWRNTTGFYKERLLEHGSWALGALAIGIGILPLLIGVSALARPKDEPRDPRTRAFVTTSVAALAVFVWYAAIKGAYLSTTFSTLVVERNVMYLARSSSPRRRSRSRAASAAAGRSPSPRGLTLYVIVVVPLRLDIFPYYEAHGLAIGHFMNREFRWSEGVDPGRLRRRLPPGTRCRRGASPPATRVDRVQAVAGVAAAARPRVGAHR